ncbi:MAG: hypothetical protein HQ592_13255 [Planctomycetes bacterium]|nr:hypothetical protein [Planctomycetota bacterium]
MTRKAFDIAPFALPNCEPGEVRFEEPRDVAKVIVTFKKEAPARIGLSYLQKTWPQTRVEQWREMQNPCGFGWMRMDDWFNGQWRKAPIVFKRETKSRVAITFRGTAFEFPEIPGYDVLFRRTLGVRVDVADPASIESVAVFTRAETIYTRLHVDLNAGRRTPGKTISFDAYNAHVRSVVPGRGVAHKDGTLQLQRVARRNFELEVIHMRPAHRHSGDDGNVRFILDNDSFTISLPQLEGRGPVWFAEKGFFIKLADDPTTFDDYRAACQGSKTVAEMVSECDEQTYFGAFHGQPRPHAVAWSIGCKHARQRFWLETNGDVLLRKWNITSIPGKDTPRYANEGSGRFFFGLEDWATLGRCTDPAPVPAYNVRLRRAAIELEQTTFAVPLERSILEGEPAGDESIVCMARFRFTNTGDSPATAELPIRYSRDSGLSKTPYSPFAEGLAGYTDRLLPAGTAEPLRVRGGRVYGTWKRKPAIRCAIDSTMTLRTNGKGVVISKHLQPGESCEAVVKIPYINIDTTKELKALDTLDANRCHAEMARFWQDEIRKGAQVHTPVPQLNNLHAAHLQHVQITDFAMPGDPGLINTSVGASMYGNFPNESCMIVQELDQRGMVDDARRRLETWVRYQGTAPQPGNFTDFDGMYFGAGGYEAGYYNQHHGWVLWRLCEHFLYNGDKAWFRSVAESVIAGADWVFRQRRNTMRLLPHSRGWEHGFLPAGSLEDVTDFFYWLSTNVLTWRGVDSAARALEEIGHPEAGRVRREADAYAKDLRRGFETMRRHTPLVRLRNGRWVPNYPSRLYCRGRDLGWIREVLEGSIYLLISGLYRHDGREARWILDDYQDNRYLGPPSGYIVADFDKEWFARGGFSMQPNLLAGLMPYLDRDEPEQYIRMFFNAWCACYREETNAMVEHPWPWLGYSNSAHFKTSDQANAVTWLRYMFVYTIGDTLHLGRAVPRAWFAGGEKIGAERVSTVFGTVGISYEAEAGRIKATASLKLRRDPGKILVRFRHPEKKPIRSVKVNAKSHKAFNPGTGDVTITGHSGRVTIEARYA